MTRDELIREVAEVTNTAIGLATLKTHAGVSNVYPDPSMGSILTSDGVYVFDIQPRQYEEGDEVVRELVPWEDIDDAEAARERYTAKAAQLAREQEEAERRWKRSYLERLKKELGENA